MWKTLYELGIFTTPIVSPATPPGRGLLRISMMATHTDEHIDRTLEAFEIAGRELGLIDKNRSWIRRKKFHYSMFNLRSLRNWMSKVWN